MKCPQCGAATVVDETRIQADGSVKRTRTCFNYHTFKTNEIISSPIKQKDRPTKNVRREQPSNPDGPRTVWATVPRRT